MPISLTSPFWSVASAQDSGSRPDQQDACGAWLSRDGRTVLAVLADGAGGHHDGARAAKLAVQAAQTLWESEPPTENAHLDFLNHISAAAHQAIQSEVSGTRAARATWVALLATPEEAYWVHSGDSRLYHITEGKVVTRTRDHSVAQVLIDQGKIAPQDLSRHPDRSTLLQSLGGANYAPVETHTSSLQGGDIFLLCSDGLWNEVSEAELGALSATQADIGTEALQALASLAVDRAGSQADNTSLLCVQRRLS